MRPVSWNRCELGVLLNQHVRTHAKTNLCLLKNLRPDGHSVVVRSTRRTCFAIEEPVGSLTSFKHESAILTSGALLERKKFLLTNWLGLSCHHGQVSENFELPTFFMLTNKIVLYSENIYKNTYFWSCNQAKQFLLLRAFV